LQRTVDELQVDLIKSRALARESLERSQELERRINDTDKQFEETMRIHWNEANEPVRRELATVRVELLSKSDHVTQCQKMLDEEQLKRSVRVFARISNDVDVVLVHCQDNVRT
jgi:hypothetical protein